MGAFKAGTRDATEWLRDISQQIQALDYELHAALRILVKGEIDSEHRAAFIDACLKRERMMAHVLSYLAERRHQRALEQNAIVSRFPQRVTATHENQRSSQNEDLNGHDESVQILVKAHETNLGSNAAPAQASKNGTRVKDIGTRNGKTACI
jgi:hypothetical protein